MAIRSGVVIGINYDNAPPGLSADVGKRAGMNPLQYAEADARDMAAELQSAGFEVVPLLGANATRRNIIKAIEDASRRTTGNRDLLVVYFAGHGDVDPNDSLNTDDRYAYLLP